MLRAVVDTNVMVSALLFPDSNPGRVVAAALARRYELIASPRLLDELEDVLHRPKIARRTSRESATEFVEAIQGVASLAADAPEPAPASQDPNDDYLVALAVAHHAPALVTGDSDLLDAVDLPVRAVTPTAFLQDLADR